MKPIIAGILLLGGIATEARSGEKSPTSRPNVLFIFGDDQRADTIGALGNPGIQTPHLDTLVKRGVSFRRAYMQGGLHGATCIPSRAMLLSSRSLFRVDERLLKDSTWPAAFGQAGYTTFVSGKWHNGPASIPKSFQMARKMFLGGMANPLEAPLADMVDGQMNKPSPSPKHSCEMFADETIQFLANQQKEAPFFCYVPFNAPHDPHTVPLDFAVRYDPAKIPLPGNFLPQHPFDNGDMTVRDEMLLRWPRSPGAVRQILADYYRYVSYLDHQVGRILAALAKSPHANNTIIVFAADSGAARGSHGLIGKQNVYDHSMRVPLIVCGPGIPPDRRADALCYLFDVMPTLGKLCGVTGPITSEGREFTAVLKDPTQKHRAQLLFAYRDVQRAVTDGGWKLIRYPQVDQTQLFDLQSDPEEVTNLAKLPEEAARVASLLGIMGKLQKENGDQQPLFVANPKPAEWKPPLEGSLKKKKKGGG